MIPKECKRLAEVDFPIAAVSAHSAREKSIRHGHPSTLHLWWARRPLAACRSMLMALLLPDPCDKNCPDEFKREARRILMAFQGRPQRWEKELKTDAGVRYAILHEFIADFASWDNAANAAYLKTARELIKAAYGDEAPLVVDPFAGGGSIPLEALRIGCDAFASDLNPVACLINKVLLIDIPRNGLALADELSRVGTEIKKAAEKDLAKFYPSDPDGGRPIAYIWARTVHCEQPNCGCEIPLIRGLWLSKKPNRRAALRYSVTREKKSPPKVMFEVFNPTTGNDLQSVTVSRAKATCPACNLVLSADRVRQQLTAQHGGARVQFDDDGNRIGGARLIAVALLRNGSSGRQYRIANAHDYAAIYNAETELSKRLISDEQYVPQEQIPLTELRRISLPIYGISRFSDLFTARQLLSIATLSTCIKGLSKTLKSDAIARLLGLALDKSADLNNANTRWKPDAECPVNTLARHDIPMAWDFAEACPLGESSGSFLSGFERTADSIRPSYPQTSKTGTVSVCDACEHDLPDESCSVWFTDPPYYDSVPYAHLSDFFHVWLRRALPEYAKNTAPLTPKAEECVVDRPHSRIPDAKTAEHFERRVSLAMREGVRIVRKDGVASVVFAHKTTEGWEALLGGMISGGWVITGSWPITTEMGSRLNARENASLAASVHLICRPRNEGSAVGDWIEIIRELPRRIKDWMERLSDEGIRGADLVFACIGPALELFSKYARVETPDGEEIGLAANERARSEPVRRGFLSYIWEVAGRTALNQVLGSAESKAKNGAAGALEEDARLTALFLWTLQATESAAKDKAARKAEDGDEDTDNTDGTDEEESGGAGKKKAGLTMIYDVARRFAQPLGIHLDVWEGRIIETAKGIVRLLPVGERAKQLFGEEGASAVVRKFDAARKPDPQLMLEFISEAQTAAVPEVRGRGRKSTASAEGLRTRREATTLDRVHAAMLLQSSGAANALRALLEAEMQRSPDFLRLANALSALYPRDSEEKRLLDAMLLAVPR
jgi:adenine-specific DNA methylase